MKKIPELLAPVGGWEQLKAAVNNGADAVYIGGALFNARMKADNFRGEDMKAAIDYAHERRVKVYVTLNTLIKDSELEKAFVYANDLYGYGADGLILQDAGIARLIHKYLPDMPMHLSTQGTVYNRWAAEFARDLGYRRIVPARELSIVEIKEMTAACHELGIETEVFVHGALCMCYSGQCQMSRLLGASGTSGTRGAGPAGSGRSGNRGLCAQPCRLMYADDSGCKSYALSPKDLCLIEDIPALCEAGVDSLKIEGRLKRPEYVAVVTRIYRKYLDKYASLSDGAGFRVDSEDLKMLRQIFNRGDFTTGYLYGNPGDDILSGSSPKNQGLFAGRVTAVQGIKAGKKLIDVDVRGAEAGPIVMGDGVELSKTGNVVTYVEKISKNIVRIGDFKGEISIGDEVRKVTDIKLDKEAAKSFAGNSDSDIGRKMTVNMKFTAAAGKEPLLEIREASCAGREAGIVVTGGQALERAINKMPDQVRIKQQLAKLGATPFEAGDIEVRMYGDPMVPVSLINKMRREATDKLLDALRSTCREKLTEEEVRGIIDRELNHAVQEGRANGTTAACSADRATDADYGRRRLVPLEWFMEEGFDRKSAVPYILNVSKGNLDKYIEDHFEDIVSAVSESGIAIGNLGWIKQFRDRGVAVYGDYGLNVFNAQAAEAFAENGVAVIAASDEESGDGRHVMYAGENGAAAPKREPALMERVPMMITEHPLETGCLTDRKGVRHQVLKWYSKDKYLLF